MTDQILWRPSKETIETANLTRFIATIRQEYGAPIAEYKDLYRFSIENPEKFWKSVWSFCHIIAKTQGNRFLIEAQDMKAAKFFPDAQLNFAENLLRRRDKAIAIIFYGEDKVYQTLTYQELYLQTAKMAQAFKEWGIKPGDRIAGYLPNMPQAIISMLAATSIGAIWSSCSPDFGAQGVVDRFSQITPKVLVMADGYFYGGKTYSCLDRLSAIRDKIPSIKHIILVPYTCPARELASKNIKESFDLWDDLLKASSAQSIDFAQMPFNHPLFILFSSGTTGVPKCIVHGAGGTLLQHLKEHQLHCDIKPGDQVFYYTTCGWMMWNWLVSALASEASLVLYDGSATHPHPQILFDIADKEGITLFGTSAKYIDTMAKYAVEPIKTHPLLSLRLITSTGSPLMPESFDYVYRAIKKDVCLSSISGGTDIISCFSLGNPIGPVWRGELQTRGLGLAVAVFDEEGNSVIGEKGELVCTKPFPSQPLGFWNDPTSEKYHGAYFTRFSNVWHHGDFVELTSHDGMIIYGRSDTILNPRGIRIGTAEIYRQVEQIEEVLESIAVSQNWQHDERIVLFVRLKDGVSLNEDLCQKIKKQIRQNTTPRHVPAKILEVAAIPRTRNEKIAEQAVRNVIRGEPVKNQEALANPEALDQFRNRIELTQE